MDLQNIAASEERNSSLLERMIGSPNPTGARHLGSGTASSGLGATPAQRLGSAAVGPSGNSSPSGDVLKDRKEQKALNAAVSAKALEECEALLSMQETSLSYIKNKTPLYQTRFQESLNAINDVEEHYRWCSSCGWTISSLISKYNFDIQEEEMNALLSLGSPDPAGVRAILLELGSSVVGKSRLVQRRESLKEVNRFAPIPVADVTIGLYEYLHTDVLAHAKSELSRTDAGKARLIKQIEALQRQRDVALAGGDVVSLEECHRGIIDAYTELLEILTSRLDQLLLSSEDTTNFRGQLEGVKRDGNEAYGAFDQAKRTLLSRIVKDIETTERVRRLEQETHLSALTAYANQSSAAQRALKENATKQESILALIREQFQNLFVLGEERKQMVEKYIQSKTAEEQRQASYNEFVNTQAEHQALLLRLQDQTEACQSISSALLEYLHRMSAALDKREVEGELQHLSLEEAESYLTHYRNSVFAIGDLTEKKQHRIDALHRQARQLQLQRETVMDSLDPDSEIYNKQLSVVREQLEGCQSTVLQMHSLQELLADNFKRAEGVLLKEGIAFTHPLVEQSEAAAEERRKFVEKTMRYLDEEERELNKAQEAVGKLRQLTNAERAEAVKRLQSASPPRNAAQ